MIKTNSFTLACHVAGDVNAERLAILLPGRLDTKDYPHILSHVAFMAEEGYTAVTFDPPGTWESAGDIQDYTETNYAKAVAELIEYFGNKPTILIGHSRGGSIAMFVGCTNEHVIGFASIMSNVESSKYDPERVVDGVIHSRRDLPSHPDSEEKKEFRLPISYFEDGAQYDRATPLQSCTKPKLFIAGLQDKLISPDTVKSIYELSAEPHFYGTVDFEHDYRKSPEIINEVEQLLKDFLHST